MHGVHVRTAFLCYTEPVSTSVYILLKNFDATFFYFDHLRLLWTLRVSYNILEQFGRKF